MKAQRLLVACDAELYNTAEIRTLLGGAEESMPVAAVLAGLYERFGTAFLDKLRGDFSVIVWDRRQKTLFAAIDGFGIHPLVYYEDANVLLLASRIDALLASGEVPSGINSHAIANYLNYTVNLAPETFFSKVKRILPGTFLLASEGQIRAQRYWDIRYDRNADLDENELSRRLESLVEESVQAHSNGAPFSELGAFLSGGTDSSTVVGMMSRLQRGAVKTFSIGFEEQRFNELEYARISARKFGAEHHEYLVSAEDCLDALPNMVRYFDEPFGNSSAIPTYFCARLAAQHGTSVLLAGDGGDELFGGNERYLTDKVFGIYQRVPRLLRKGIVEPALRWTPVRNGLVGTARSYVRRSNLPQPHRFFSYNLLLANPPNEIFEPDFLRDLGGYSVLERPSAYYREGPAREHLDRLLYLDLKVTLGDNDLLKVTRMAELAGVRSRFPLLDRSVAEFSGLIPAALKVKGFKKRYLFKRAFRDLLPPEVLHKKKHGFGIPVAVWMKSHPRMKELTHDILLSQRTYERGYVRRSFVEEMLRKHESDETAFYGDTLWTFLTLELWFRQFIDQPRKGAAMRIVEVREESALLNLAADWNKLLAESASDTIFLTWEWVSAWWCAYGEPGALRILLAIDREGTLRGIAPMRWQTTRRYGRTFQTLAFIGDGSNDSDYLDFIAAVGYESRVLDAFLKYWDKDLAHGTLLQLNEIPESSPNLGLLRAHAGGTGMVSQEQDVECATVSLPSNWQDYLKSLSSRFRTKIRSVLRNLENRSDVSFHFCDDPAQLSRLLPALYELHGRRWAKEAKPGVFHWDKKRLFYETLSPTLVRSRLALLLLVRVERPDSGFAIWIHVPGHVFSTSGRLSPSV